MEKNEIKKFSPASRKEWRQWLQVNHQSQPAVWLVLNKKASGKPFIAWSEAVDEALCFGWIDSIRKPVDNESFMQFFCKRKPVGTWSKINKEKVDRLISDGLMSKAGLDSIEKAKQNGSWNILDDVEALKIPGDLEKAFKAHKGSKAYFMSLSKSVRKRLLHWVSFAKRPETRQNRMAELAELAGQKTRPKQFL